MQKCTNQINDSVELVRGELTTMSRTTLGALIVIDVHGKTVFISFKLFLFYKYGVSGVILTVLVMLYKNMFC